MWCDHIPTTTRCVPQRRMYSRVAPQRGIEVTLPQAASLAGSVLCTTASHV